MEWDLIKAKKLLSTPVFNVLQKSYNIPKELGKFKAYVLDIPDWVNIIGTNKAGEILLIREYRFGTDNVELEIPGGIVEYNEDPKDAAIRELKEETGYGVKNIELIGSVACNPAIMNNKCHSFLAELSDKGNVSLDPYEIIESIFCTPIQVKNYLIEGKITNAYVVNALLWFMLKNYDVFYK